MPGATLLESSPAEKELGVLVATKLNMSQPCALPPKKASGFVGCTRQSVTNRSTDVILPLSEATAGVVCPVAVANCILWCVIHSIGSQSKEVILPPYLALMWPHLEYRVLRGTPVEKGCEDN